MSTQLSNPPPTKQVNTCERFATQRQVVEHHFRNVTKEWGPRYDRKPRKMSDLDLLLRRQSVHEFIRRILEQAPNMLRVLDLGCGSGHVWDGIPRDRVQLIGTDIVSEMVRSAANHTPGDRFLVADAAQLPFDTNSLDLITCLGVLEYVPDPSSALASMARVLRPSGQLIISFPNRTGLFRMLSRYEVNAEKWIESRVNRLLGKHDPQPDVPSYKHNQWTRAESLNLLRSAGFNASDVRFNTFGLWGRLGHLRASLFLSRWLSKQFGDIQCFGSAFACTMVIRAHKSMPPIATSEDPTFQSVCSCLHNRSESSSCNVPPENFRRPFE